MRLGGAIDDAMIIVVCKLYLEYLDPALVITIARNAEVANHWFGSRGRDAEALGTGTESKMGAGTPDDRFDGCSKGREWVFMP